MSDIMNVGVRALLVNQGALQTVGNNIANVNTPGYSRQSVVLTSVPGQFSGSGYFGKGVDIVTVQRNYSDFLTKQAALTKSAATFDTTRYNSLVQLENIFQGGQDGLGATINDMLNAFSDIVSAPSDLTARAVVLTRAEEMASRFQQMAQQIANLRSDMSQQLANDQNAINSLAQQIANANNEIARQIGSGQLPNDLLDQRDQLINELNKYVQTSQIPADDGSISIFIGGSQPLVLGTTVSPVSIKAGSIDFPQDTMQFHLEITVAGVPHAISESMLGGGEVAGLLRFNNTDLMDASNMLGRMALAIGTRMNEQQALGLDLNGNPGTAMFSLAAPPNGLPASTNAGAATLTVGIQGNPSGTTAFLPSDYELKFTTATAGNIVRQSDGAVVPFDFGATNPVLLDGLTITSSGGAVAGDSFLLKPFSAAAGSIQTAFSSPRGLAMASPVAASGGTANQGSLTVADLSARSVPAPAAVTLTFTGPGTYTRSDTGATVYAYAPGQPIEYSTAPPLTGWSLTLKGTPQAGDTYTVQPNAYPALSAGNAQPMLNLRDLAMFDGGPLTDGYAAVIASIGTRVQSARSAMTVSENIATNIERNRASVSGVNLDEEAARMLQYQQAYQAAGKMLQIAQNVFDTLIQNLGR